MFFDRSGPRPASSLQQPKTPSRRRRNWAALSLAAAMAAPIGATQLSRLYAQEPAPQGDRLAQAAGNLDLIELGRRQFEQRQYEQAETTLTAVKIVGLSDKDRDAYLDLMTAVKHAAIERRSAREELLDGLDAAKFHQHIEAEAHFKTVANNRFADEQTLKTAAQQLAVLRGNEPAGHERVQFAAEVPPATQPAQASAPAATQAPVQKQASQPLHTAREYYQLGLQEYRANDWANAKENFQLAAKAGFKPTLFEDSPAEYVKRMELRDQADHERIQKLMQATTAPANGNAAGGAGNPDALAALKATAEAEQIRRQQAVAQSQEWVRQAQEAEHANNYDRALDLYTRAAELDPTNAAARQGRDNVLVLQGRNPSPTNLGNEESQRIGARKGEISYQVQNNLDQAQQSIRDRRFDNAQIAIDRARVASSADPGIFTPAELRRFRQQIDQTELDLRQQQQAAEAAAQQANDQAIQKRIQHQQQIARLERQRTIADLIRTSEQLTNQGRYREALQTVDQILLLDPTNDYAVGVKPLLQDKDQFAMQRDFMERRAREITTQLNNAEEKMIPYDDVLRYPSDWPDISQTRDQTVAAERGQNREDRAVDAQLNRTLPELQFDAVGFSDVIDFLRDVSGANLFVNWKALEAAGVDRNTPVTTRLRNIRFSKALSTILDSVGGGTTKLGYTVDDGVITVSTADDLAKNVAVRVYDIRDLIINVPDFTNAPQFSLDASQNQQGGGGGGGGGGGFGGGGGQVTVANSLFANQGQLNQQQQQGPTRQELVDEITKLIEDTVATDTWKDNGGSVGALRELQGQLIVTQTPENHRQLVNLLEQLRETRAIQVTIETRFLTVQRNYLEDVGVDLNFLFNLNQSWSKNFGTIPLTTPSSTFTQNPTTGVQGSLSTGTTTPVGLTTAATYLDDFQVQLVMRATQASVTSTLVTAPRITIFNGQRAYVIVSTQRAYVSNLTPQVSTGSSAFAPTIGIVQSGVLLDVQATVSADRKYVTLTLRPQLATLLDLANFTFQSSGASNIANNGIGSVNLPATGTIQEPEIQITAVNTTVSVPDGGTLLLGGQTVAGEQEREIGTPILSKIPILKRLFTNRSMAKDEQILLILVRPTIIMQREIEQKQFPLLTSKLNNG